MDFGWRSLCLCGRASSKSFPARHCLVVFFLPVLSLFLWLGYQLFVFRRDHYTTYACNVFYNPIVLFRTHLVSPSEVWNDEESGDKIVSNPAVQALLLDYFHLHQEMMNPKRTVPKRFLVVDAWVGNVGNRHSTMVGYLLLAMRLRRALVWVRDPDLFVQYLQFPLDIYVEDLPPSYRMHISAWMRNHRNDWPHRSWASLETAFCEPFASASAYEVVWMDGSRADDAQRQPEDAPFWVLSERLGAPRLSMLLLNPSMRDWFQENIGVSLPEVSRWLHRLHSCARPQVDDQVQIIRSRYDYLVGIHLRRGIENDLYKPSGWMNEEYGQIFWGCALHAIRSASWNEKRTAVFLATDQMYLLEDAKRYFGRVGIPVYANSATGRAPDGEQGLAWEDFGVLTNADALVLTRGSTFSQMAAFQSRSRLLYVPVQTEDVRLGRANCSLLAHPMKHMMQLTSPVHELDLSLNSLRGASCFEPKMEEAAVEWFGN